MKFHCKTLKFQIEEITGTINLTPLIEKIVKKSGIRNGHGIIQVRHSTAGLISQEDEENLLKKDLPELLDHLVPPKFGHYHDDLSQRLNVGPTERRNGRAHLEHLVIGHDSKSFIVRNYKINFGYWLRVILIDFDPIGREPREVDISVMGE